MSIKVMTAVWEHSICEKSSSLLLLLALADHADDDGICWPSIARLAKKIRRSERQTKRVLAGLEAAGEIYRMSGIGRSNTSHYLVAAGQAENELLAALTGRFELAWDEARAIVNAIMTMRKGDTSDTIVTQKGDMDDTIPETEKVTPATQKGDISGEKVTPVAKKGDIAMSPESSENRQENHHEPSQARQESQAMFSALAKLCQIDIGLMTKAQRGALNQSEKRLRKAGICPADLGEFEDWWYECDWRGRKGEAPKPAQVRETWGQFVNRGKHSKKASPTSSDPAGYPAIQEWLESKGVQASD